MLKDLLLQEQNRILLISSKQPYRSVFCYQLFQKTYGFKNMLSYNFVFVLKYIIHPYISLTQREIPL